MLWDNIGKVQILGYGVKGEALSIGWWNEGLTSMIKGNECKTMIGYKIMVCISYFKGDFWMAKVYDPCIGARIPQSLMDKVKETGMSNTEIIKMHCSIT